MNQRIGKVEFHVRGTHVESFLLCLRIERRNELCHRIHRNSLLVKQTTRTDVDGIKKHLQTDTPLVLCFEGETMRIKRLAVVDLLRFSPFLYQTPLQQPLPPTPPSPLSTAPPSFSSVESDEEWSTAALPLAATPHRISTLLPASPPDRLPFPRRDDESLASPPPTTHPP